MKQKKYSANARINSLVRSLIKQGCTYKKGKKHGKVVSPDGKVRISVPGTPSDWRAPRQFRAEVKRRYKRHK